MTANPYPILRALQTALFWLFVAGGLFIIVAFVQGEISRRCRERFQRRAQQDRIPRRRR